MCNSTCWCSWPRLCTSWSDHKGKVVVHLPDFLEIISTTSICKKLSMQQFTICVTNCTIFWLILETYTNIDYHREITGLAQIWQKLVHHLNVQNLAFFSSQNRCTKSWKAHCGWCLNLNADVRRKYWCNVAMLFLGPRFDPNLLEGGAVHKSEFGSLIFSGEISSLFDEKTGQVINCLMCYWCLHVGQK